MSKLKETDRLLIIKRSKAGMTSRAIAFEMGLGKSTVGDFLRKETYKIWWIGYSLAMSSKTPVVERDTFADISSHVHTGGVTRKATSPSQGVAARNISLAFAGAINRVNIKGTITPDVFKIVTSDEVAEGCTHFVIPDPQCKPDVDLSYCDWIGEMIADKQPDVIINIGDHADMQSLSSYDKGTKKAEGRRIHDDFAASIEGMRRLLKPIYDLQQKQLEMYGYIKYKPKMVLTLGNHEERIMRHVNANPELAGFVGYDNLKYKEFGWKVIDFLVPYSIHGVNYVHYMANPMTGRPYGGAALNILKQVGESFVMGHKQCLDVATRFLPASGRQQWAIIAGASYSHDEDYKGPQGNKHWRGVVMLHNVKDGNFNIMTTDLAYLEGRYGK